MRATPLEDPAAFCGEMGVFQQLDIGDKKGL
jgi:hypothetical protein